jgi:hypothetical protein
MKTSFWGPKRKNYNIGTNILSIKKIDVEIKKYEIMLVALVKN